MWRTQAGRTAPRLKVISLYNLRAPTTDVLGQGLFREWTVEVLGIMKPYPTDPDEQVAWHLQRAAEIRMKSLQKWHKGDSIWSSFWRSYSLEFVNEATNAWDAVKL
jgi:hypothetical protein